MLFNLQEASKTKYEINISGYYECLTNKFWHKKKTN